jgi:hypothetical protein
MALKIRLKCLCRNLHLLNKRVLHYLSNLLFSNHSDLSKSIHFTVQIYKYHPLFALKRSERTVSFQKSLRGQ